MSVELDRRDFVGAMLLNAVALAASGTASAQSPAQSPAGQT